VAPVVHTNAALHQNIDIGLGMCLQCCGEHKMDLIKENEVCFAITTAPAMHQIQTPQGNGQIYLPAPTCWRHLQVGQAPSMLDPRMPALRIPRRGATEPVKP
jgi:hypothetical protein